MNKTVLITGASSGIGAGCAKKFASEGARLILNARSTDKLMSLAHELKDKYNTECYVMPFDVCDRKAASEALTSLPDEWKSIDILINNAGLAIGTDKEHEGNIEEWDTVIDTNIKALLSMTRWCHLVKRISVKFWSCLSNCDKFISLKWMSITKLPVNGIVKSLVFC